MAGADIDDAPGLPPQASPEPPAPRPGPGRRRGPVKITVNLLARVMDKLEEITDWTGESKTDAINRAIQLYGLYQDAVRKGETFRLVSADGTQRDVHIL
ncbi:hypothetical protein Ari01nite_13360 [Paractinoplanes rishiriensis]|uniref:Uncharacterized protein n=1 Tax=Paractinoplanes rishiriensis TaxID=1050105 RepID=A0A919JRL7_9ACTN|nr:hypothetical protein Ari01nite_13360 [Actinoplanes rishiriensis]